VAELMLNDTLLPYLLFMNSGNPSFDYQTEHVFAMNSGAQLPFCNRVYGTAETTSSEIAQVKNFYGTTPFRWFVESTETTLIQRLEESGLSYKISFPAMTINLKTLVNEKQSNSIEVKKIDSENLTLWISLVTQSYNISDVSAFAQFIDYLISKNGHKNLHFYTGYYQGTPAASSMAIDHGKSVGLHWVGTLPEYRHKGLGYAVSLQPLREAKKKGFAQALLFASEMGKPVYEKIGFKEYALYKVFG
jgi:predicted GNAT family acetyltransferase